MKRILKIIKHFVNKVAFGNYQTSIIEFINQNSAHHNDRRFLDYDNVPNIWYITNGAGPESIQPILPSTDKLLSGINRDKDINLDVTVEFIPIAAVDAMIGVCFWN